MKRGMQMGKTQMEKSTITEVREFWDDRPCNIRHSLSPIGTREYFDEVEQRKYFVEPHITKFANFDRWGGIQNLDRRLDRVGGGYKVLEIGCGIGTDTINFARAGAEVTAIDISLRSVNLARKRAEVYGLNNKIKFYVGNAEDMCNIVPHEPYDLIYSFGVLHHTPLPERVLQQVRDYYTHPFSVLKVMLYHKYSWRVLCILAEYGGWKFFEQALMGNTAELDKIVARHSEAQTGCPVTTIYSPKDAEALLRSCGFAPIVVNIEHIFPYKIDEYILHKYIKEWYFKYMPDKVFKWLERHFGWHMCITAVVE